MTAGQYYTGEALSDEDSEILAYLRQQGAESDAARYGIERCAPRQYYPLSSGQQRLWFLDQVEPGNPAYHYCFRLRFTDAFSRDALTAALNEVGRRHEVLRARFFVHDLDLVQTIAPVFSIELPPVDLSGRSAEDREREESALIARLNEEPFDLSRGPLVRGLLIRQDAQAHLLAICLHHIVTDHWSMDIFVRELGALYAAYAAGHSSPLGALPIQYTDYAVWERASQKSESCQRSLVYWRAHLADLSTLDLPLDRARPATRGFGSAKVVYTLPGAITEGVRREARAESATSFMCYLMAFAVMLQRVTGHSDIAVGTPVSNRVLPELESLIGYFTNTLVLRTDLSGNPDIREALGRVQAMLLDAYRHQEVPFEMLVETLAPRRDLTRSPLFQVLFVYLERSATVPRSVRTPGNGPELSQPDKVSTDYDLEVYVTEQADSAVIAFHYKTDIFNETTIGRMLGYFAAILRAMAFDGGQRIGEISLLSAEQRARIIAIGRGPDRAVPQACVHRVIEDNARNAPDAVAVESGREWLTYGALNGRANRLARRLRALGVGPRTLVGICMDRSADLVVSVLGVMKSGAAYVPLDAAFPPERLRFMVQDSGLQVIVSRGGLAGEVLPESAATVVELDAGVTGPDGADAGDLEEGPGPEDLAYVIFTSGSTGRPKGVCIGHRALANFVQATAELLEMRAHDRLLGVASLSFDASVLDLYVPLVSGARVVLAERDAAADGVALAGLVERSGATLMHATPATWQLLRLSGWQGRAGLRALSGGEALPWPLADWLTTVSDSVLNLYGPTEATVYVAIGKVERGGGQGVVGIGRPLANTSIHVLDAALQPVPPRLVGELCIGGVQVARGYLGRDDLTARQFVADRLGDAGGARIYRTGDLARYRDDGSIEFLGRADHQVKLRGHRIELGEIESVLAEDAGVAQAVVLCREDVAGDKRLVAYVLAAGSGGLDPAALRARLGARLPAYMVPAAVVVLERMPLTPNRKIDRAALPAPGDATGATGATGAVAEAATGMEQLLVEMWREALGGVPVGVHDNFFDLGGHSLLVITVIERMRSRTGVVIPTREYMMQSLRQIAASYEREQPGARAARLAGSARAGSAP